MSDLVKRLDIKAGVMEMGEKIAWGSDTALMRESARAIEAKDKRIAELEAAALLVVQTSGNWKLENQHADAVLKLKALLGGEG
mgnify:CR=1 FL=1